MRFQRFAWIACLIVAAASMRARADEAATRPVAHVNHAGLLKLSWQLACQASTFHDRTTLEMIDLLHSLNFHHIELAPGQVLSPDRPNVTIGPDMTPADLGVLPAKLHGVHMDIVSYGVVRPSGDEADTRKLFDLAKTLKAKDIVVDPADDSLDLLDKLANEYRINVAIVNFPKPGNHWDPDAELRLLTGRSSRIGICADIVSWRKSGLSPVDSVRKLAGHVLEIHLADIDDHDHETPLGSGVADVSGVLGELKQQGFKGICAIEYGTGSGDALVDQFTLSVNAFSDIVGELSRAK
jgi:sugar phosphate isomerase/epimerase